MIPKEVRGWEGQNRLLPFKSGPLALYLAGRIGFGNCSTGRELRIRTSMIAANDLSVRRTPESAGVEFIDENGGGLGVRLRQGSAVKDEPTIWWIVGLL
jgi:hypothetical protein